MSIKTATKVIGDHEIESFDEMPDRVVNELPFAAIRLDRSGKILRFNRYAANLTGRDPKRVIGRNLFDDVAPCTNVESFAGRYREGVELGSIQAVFPFVFDCEMPQRDVRVALSYNEGKKYGWVFFRES